MGHSTPLRGRSAHVRICATRPEGTPPACSRDPAAAGPGDAPRSTAVAFRGPQHGSLFHFLLKSEEEREYRREEPSPGCSHRQAPTVVKSNL